MVSYGALALRQVSMGAVLILIVVEDGLVPIKKVKYNIERVGS